MVNAGILYHQQAVLIERYMALFQPGFKTFQAGGIIVEPGNNNRLFAIFDNNDKRNIKTELADINAKIIFLHKLDFRNIKKSVTILPHRSSP